MKIIKSAILSLIIAFSLTTHPSAYATGYDLCRAADQGDFARLKKALANDANPDHKCSGINRALHIATEHGHVRMVKALLKAGANPKLKDLFGNTALDVAIKEGNDKIAAILRGSKPKSNSVPQDSSSETPAPKLIASLPQEGNTAEHVFESAWRSIVVVKQGEIQGSGVIVRPNVVATNCHVVDSYSDIVVYKHDNRRASTDTLFDATIRRQNISKDFCLLDVPGLQGIVTAARRYDTLKIGEDVYAIGSPKGLDLSLSSGLISQLRRSTNNRYIQTDAAISPGSSGGGLFDSNGNLIGILTEKIADEDVEGIGFAIPADLVLK